MGTTFEGSVIDNDLLGAIPRTVGGVEVSPDTLSFEVIGDTVMGVGHYLGHAQTFARIKADYVYPEIADRRSISESRTPGRATGCAGSSPGITRAISAKMSMQRSGAVTTSSCRARECSPATASGTGASCKPLQKW